MVRALPCKLVTQSTQQLLRIWVTWVVQACGHAVAVDAASQRFAQCTPQGAGMLCWLALAGSGLPARPQPSSVTMRSRQPPVHRPHQPSGTPTSCAQTQPPHPH